LILVCSSVPSVSMFAQVADGAVEVMWTPRGATSLRSGFEFGPVHSGPF
jgi:hypothetical protein